MAGHSEVDHGGAVAGGDLVHLGEFLVGGGEADLQAPGFAGPVFTLGFADAGDQVAADLGQPWPLGGVRPQQRAADAPLTELTPTGKTSRQTVYALTSLTSAHVTPRTWPASSASTGPSRHTITRDVTFREHASTSRTGSGPANLATIRAVITALKDAGYLHIPKADATTPPTAAKTLHLHDLD